MESGVRLIKRGMKCTTIRIVSYNYTKMCI